MILDINDSCHEWKLNLRKRMTLPIQYSYNIMPNFGTANTLYHIVLLGSWSKLCIFTVLSSVPSRDVRNTFTVSLNATINLQFLCCFFCSPPPLYQCRYKNMKSQCINVCTHFYILHAYSLHVLGIC